MNGHRYLQPGNVLRYALVLCLLYSAFVVTKRVVARTLFSQTPPEGVRQAIDWDPDNPLYYMSLGRALQESPGAIDPEEVVRLLTRATELSPRDTRTWAALGGAYEWLEQPEKAIAAFERAQELFPNSPAVNWQLGNFYLRQDRALEALRIFRIVIEGNPELRLQSFDLAWRATDNAGLILDEMLPPDIETLLEYLTYLAQTGRVDETTQVWVRALQLNRPFRLQKSFPYLNALIQAGRVPELLAAWAALSKRYPATILRDTRTDNLIHNDGFEGRILNGGLGWHVRPVKGVVSSIDKHTFLDGTRSLKVYFNGTENVEFHHVFQYVPVRPNTLYRFTAFAKSKDLTTDSLPQIQIRDPYDRSRLNLQVPIQPTTMGWSLLEMEFQTPPETGLIVVSLTRSASRRFNNKIKGRLWLDRTTLSLIE